eukprot:8142264-Ditylum_brightwellii.AAC.1
MYVDNNKTMHNNGVYNATGGLLERLKTTYSLMVWEFAEDDSPFIIPQDMLPPNTVKLCHAGISTTLKRSAEDKAIRNMRVCIALTLQIRTELEYLKIKTHKFATAVTVCKLRNDKIWKGYFTIYISSVSHSFPAMPFVEKELQKLDAILMPKLLTKLGFK